MMRRAFFSRVPMKGMKLGSAPSGRSVARLVIWITFRRFKTSMSSSQRNATPALPTTSAASPKMFFPISSNLTPTRKRAPPIIPRRCFPSRPSVRQSSSVSSCPRPLQSAPANPRAAICDKSKCLSQSLFFSKHSDSNLHHRCTSLRPPPTSYMPCIPNLPRRSFPRPKGFPHFPVPHSEQ
jgi:hypothetical protein